MFDIHSLEVIAKEKQRDLLALAGQDALARCVSRTPGRRLFMGRLLVTIGRSLARAGERIRGDDASHEGAAGGPRLAPAAAREGYTSLDGGGRTSRAALGVGLTGVPEGIPREGSHVEGAAG